MIEVTPALLAALREKNEQWNARKGFKPRPTPTVAVCDDCASTAGPFEKNSTGSLAHRGCPEAGK